MGIHGLDVEGAGEWTGAGEGLVISHTRASGCSHRHYHVMAVQY